MQNTLKKFGHPETLVKEYKNWWLLRRLKQVTLGSLILLCKDDVHAFSEISEGSFSELPKVIKDIESNLKKSFQNDKVNYLMLMMYDPEVHFHIIPRYSRDGVFNGITFRDYGWPDVPDQKKINEVDGKTFEKLIEKLKAAFF